MSDLSSSDSSSPTSKAHQIIYYEDGTLASQQEFLDSLKPIPLESVEENSRKCGYCWRTYGEPNPGQDDAEAPVQFQNCKHVFGEQCMRSLFAIREPVRLDLKPLSFAPGSRGADLGSRLRSYVEARGVEKSASLTGGNREKDFVQLLREIRPATAESDYIHKTGIKLLGSEWYGLYYEMYVQSDYHLGKVHLLENAIILDREITTAEQLPPTNYWTPAGGLGHALNSTAPFPVAPGLSPPVAYSEPNIEKPTCDGNNTSPYLSNHQGGPYSPLFYNPISASNWEAEEFLGSLEQKLIQQSVFGQEAYESSPVNQKEGGLAQIKVTKVVHQEIQLKNQTNVVQTDQPLVLQDFQKEEQNITTKIASKHTQSDSQQEKDVSTKQKAPKPYQQQAQYLGTWKDALSSQSKLDSLISKHKELEAKLGKSKQSGLHNVLPPGLSSMMPTMAPHLQHPSGQATSPTATHPLPSNLPQLGQSVPQAVNTLSPQEILKKKQVLKKKQAKLQAESYEKRYTVFCTKLARAFSDIYTAYERHLVDEAIAAGRPPPIKKLRLADYKHSSKSPSPSSSSTASSPDSSSGIRYELERPRTVNLVATIHERQKDDKGIEVSQPYPLFDLSGDDTEDEDDESENQGSVNEDKMEAFMAGKVIFLKRVSCDRCYRMKPFSGGMQVPDYVFWKDRKGGPDDCPRCRRVLFKKS